MLRDLPVRDLMVTDVLTFSPDQNVQDAMRELVTRSVHGAPVVDDDRRVIGVLSVGDCIVEEARLHFPTIVNFFGVNVALPWHDKELDEDVSKALGMFVHELMTAEAVTVGPDATIEDAATAMHDRQVSRLPVVDGDGRLVGLITRTDILRAVVRGFDDPGAYDAGEESTERLGEVGGAPVDAAAREASGAARAAGSARSPRHDHGGGGGGAPAVHEAEASDEQEHGADIGRI